MSEGYVFYNKNGQPYVVRCLRCLQENWAPAVASGQCAWCGHKEPEREADGARQGDRPDPETV